MNAKIEWLTAPLGTTAYQPSGPEQHEGWYRKNECGEVMWWQVGREGKEQWAWMGGRRDYPYGAIIRPAEKVIVRLQTTAEQLGWAAIDWSKAPEGTMGFHPQTNGYVDHWVKWAENGDNWFCTCGFEAGGWVKFHVNLNSMSHRYRTAIIVRPQQTEPADGLHSKMHNAWLEYAHLNGIVGGIQGQISMQLFYAGFAAGVRAGQP